MRARSDAYVLAAACSVLLLAGCSSESSVAASNPGGENSPRQVAVTRVQAAPFQDTVSALGSLLAYEQSVVSLKVPGRIESIQVDIGSCVERGAVLAQVETRDLALRVEQAEAALAQAEARLGIQPGADLARVVIEETATVRQAQAVLEEARLKRGRTRQLFDEGILSKADMDTVTSQYEVAEARYQEAIEEVHNRRALVAQRRSELAIARQDLQDASMVAPFSGCVQQRTANIGEYLNEGAPVVTLVRMDPLRLRVQVPERDAAAVRPGQPISFRIEGDPNTYSTKVSRVSPAIAEQGRIVVVESEVKHQASLRPGSFVRAEIVTKADAQALAVPASAVLTFAGIDKVMLVNEGKATEREIRTGRTQGRLVEVLSGLNGGELVIVRPEGVKVGEAVIPKS